MKRFVLPAVIGVALAIGTQSAFAATKIQAAVSAALQKLGYVPVQSKVIGGPQKLTAPKGTKIDGKEVKEVTVMPSGQMLLPGEKESEEEGDGFGAKPPK